MTALSTPTSLVKEFQGLALTRLQVLGVNALKTVEPPVTALDGLLLGEVQELPGRILRLSLGDFTVVLDLGRTGTARRVAAIDDWRPGQGSMPTIRMIFEGGQSLDFHEPRKTKRISIRLTPSI